MKRLIALLALLPLLLHAEDPRVGLVLSGGGAKGIAEIGFIQALEDNDIPIDCVVGTSMGSIVSSLYACGLSPAQMMQLIHSSSFARWSSGQMPGEYTFSFVSPRPTAQWVGLNINPADSDAIETALPTRLINPLPMSFAFLKLYAPFTLQCRGDFNRLMVPLRTVASDIFNHRSVVFSHGQLSEAVRASMSFPFVFQPIKVNGALLYDGGLYDVYPVDVMMQDFSPQRLIGVNVSAPNTRPGLNGLITQMEDMIVNDAPYPFPDSIGVNVRFNLTRFGLLDWGAADSIYAIGYKRAIEDMDSIKAVIPWRRPKEQVEEARRQFAANTPKVTFSDIEIRGTSQPKADYIRYLFGSMRQWFDMDAVQRGFYRVASTGRLRNLVPHILLNDSTEASTLLLDADVDKDFRLAFGGYLTSAASSMLYISASYDPFALLRPGVTVEGWAGQCYQAFLARSAMNLPTPVPSRAVLTAAVMRTNEFETAHAFYDFSEPAFLHYTQLYAKGAYEMAAGEHGTIVACIGWGHLSNGFHAIGADDADLKAHYIQNLGKAALTYSLSTLSDPLIPRAGSSVKLTAAYSFGNRRLTSAPISHHTSYFTVDAALSHYFTLARKFSVGIGLDGHYSSLPLLADYRAAIAVAKPFAPLPSSRYLFDHDMRSNAWIAPSIHPVWTPVSTLQLRLDGYLYMPIKTIDETSEGTACYSSAFPSVEFLGQFSIALHLPFGTLQAYGTYRTTSGRHWNAGISLGLPITAPDF